MGCCCVSKLNQLFKLKLFQLIVSASFSLHKFRYKFMPPFFPYVAKEKKIDIFVLEKLVFSGACLLSADLDIHIFYPICSHSLSVDPFWLAMSTVVESQCY